MANLAVEIFLRPFTVNKRKTIGLFLSVVWLLWSGQSSLPAQTQAQKKAEAIDVQPLSLTQPVERDKKDSEIHRYSVTLAAGQFLRVFLYENQLNLKMTFFTGDNKEIGYSRGYAPNLATDEGFLLAPQSGEYFVEVRSWRQENKSGKYKLAVQDLRAATEQDKTRVKAGIVMGEAINLLQTNNNEVRKKGIPKYEEAIGLFQTVGDLYGETIANLDLGTLHRAILETEKALVYYQKALELSQKSGDRRLESQANYRLQEHFFITGDHRKALEYNFKYLEFSRQLGSRQNEGVALNNLCANYNLLGDQDNAIDYCQQALKIRREINDAGVVQTINNLSAIYKSVGEPFKALEGFNETLEIFRLRKSRLSEAFALNNIGGTYENMRDFDKALVFHHQALTILKEEKDTRQLSTVFNSIGVSHYQLGEYEKALDFFQQAYDLYQQNKNPWYASTTQGMIGLTYHMLGDRQKAIEQCEQALTIKRSLGDRVGEGRILRYLGTINYAAGNTAKALEFYNQALPIVMATANPLDEAIGLFAIARIQNESGNIEAAQTNVDKAIARIESIRSKIEIDSARTLFLASLKDFYDLKVDLLMQLHQRDATKGYDALAFQFVERGRARTLLDTLARSRIDLRAGLDAGMLEKDKDLQSRLYQASQQLQKVLNAKHTGEQLEKARKDYELAKIQTDEFQAKLQSLSPRYAAITKTQPLTLDEIRQQLIDDDTLLLEYSLGKDRSYLFAVSSNVLKVFNLPKRSEIDSAAKQVYDLLAARNKVVKFETVDERKARIAKAESEYAQAANGLSRMILAPVASQIQNKKLLVVGDGALQYIPFAALPVAKPESRNPNHKPTVGYLGITNEIVSLPSISTLAVMRRELKDRKPAAKTIAIFADPVFDKADERLKSAQANRKGLSNMVAQSRGITLAEENSLKEKSHKPAVLDNEMTRAMADVEMSNEGLSLPRIPFTRKEAMVVASLVASTQRKAAIDFAANRETATSRELSDYRIIHFATHGFLNTAHPELSGIVLSMVDEGGNEVNGFLRAHEIYNLKLPAELVVLSGCRTGLGKEIRGEGLVGLTRGFMYAGAARVLVSLWDVSDEATAEFMGRFYRAMLKEGMSAAAALKAVRASMAKDKRWSSPYYWAAFVLQGEPK
ncbi:MAG: CHAT domain-containing protein [Acidobacteriota bacterium]